jgi:Relaxase/Mobilisation nuclease domain.
MWGKNGGIQAHHVIQSFKPDEVTPEKANELGQELAEKLGKGHEVLIYTHSDTDHIHNHIVINSVNFEDGYKFQLHGKEGIEKARNLSDEICKEHGLSIVNKPAPQRYHQAEYGLAKRGIISWKDELRQAIDLEKKLQTILKSFKRI